MGSDQSTNKQTTPTTITNGEWKNLGNRFDYNLGQVRIYQNQQDLNSFIALQQVILQSEAEFSQMWSRLKKQSTMYQKVPGIIKILEINNSSEDNFCSNFYKITAVHEYFENQLSGTLKERLVAQQSFSSQEIIDFTYQLLVILSNLYVQQQNNVNQNMGHGDIRPSNIYIKQYENNEIQYILSEPGDQYQKLLLNREHIENEFNLAPELMEPLGQRVMRLKYDRTFTDVWSIGMIALNLGTFANTQTIYDWENFTIIRPQLEKLINFFTQVHGDQLGNIIKKMLELDVYERLTIETLMDQILKLKETTKNKDETSHTQLQPESSSTSKFLVSSNKIQDQLVQSPVNNRYSSKGNHSQPASPPQYKYSLRKVSQQSQKRESQQNDQQNNVDCQKRNWAQEFFLNDSDTKVHVPCNPDEQFMNVHLDQLKSTYKSQFQYSIEESNEKNKEQSVEKVPMSDQTNKQNSSKKNEVSQETMKKLNKSNSIQKKQTQQQSNFKRPKTGVSYLNSRGSNKITNIQKSKGYGSIQGNENQQFVNSSKWQK